jgi:hypothetical protein
MSRPELYDKKKIVNITSSLLVSIEKWRRRQDPIPNVSEAIRRLIQRGLKADGIE